MTKSQERAVAQIRRLAERNLLNPETYEFKEWEVKENEYFVSVYVVTGMKGDEGTFGEVFCRDRAHLFVGKRGGITYPVYKHGRHYNKVFKGYSILQAVCDQRI